jgi:ABC-2 type transport system ATP-binding protein
MITAEHLSKTYRKKIAVNDLTFKVETGKVTGFLGPNGAGKSTTMRLMLGLDHGGGKTLYDGKPLSSHAKPSQQVGILLEAKAFHPSRSARRHLQVLAEAGGIAPARVDEVLHQVGLTAVARKAPGKFSLGMSQRLGIAAAILGEPKYLLLDEPANGLDPEGIAWLRQFLKYYADQGNAVFVSSHLLSEMALMADNVVVIGKGTMIADTSIKALLDKNAHSGVLVRAQSSTALEKALHAHKIAFTKDDSGIKIAGKHSDEIGKIAFDNGIMLLELANQQASLEEAFLELTANATEYTNRTETSS